MPQKTFPLDYDWRDYPLYIRLLSLPIAIFFLLIAVPFFCACAFVENVCKAKIK